VQQLKKVLALGKETQLLKKHLVHESVQLVKNLEEKQQKDLGDANLSSFFYLHLILTVSQKNNYTVSKSLLKSSTLLTNPQWLQVCQYLGFRIFKDATYPSRDNVAVQFGHDKGTFHSPMHCKPESNSS